MNKYAVMTFMFKPWWNDGRITHEQLLRGIAEAGAAGVEPFQMDFVEDPGLLPRYRRALDDNGLKTAAVDVMCNLVYANEHQRSKARDKMKRGLDICHELGADIAHVAGNSLVQGVSAEDGRKMIAEGLLEFVDRAEAGGMTLAIENFNPSPDLICSADDCLEILRLTGDKVKFVLDTGNFLAVNEDPDTNFERFADRICHCHFKDFTLDPDSPAGHHSCDMGTGVIPNAAVARKLLDRDYDGWVALETYSRNDMDPVTAVRRELPVLQSWFG